MPLGSQSSVNIEAAIAGTVFVGFVFTVTIVTLIVVIAVLLFRRRSNSVNINSEKVPLDVRGDGEAGSNQNTSTQRSGNTSKTKETKVVEPEKPPPPRFEVLKVEEDCELREFIESKCGLVFKRGCVFFEFTHEIEDISESKEVVLMKKVTLISIFLKYTVVDYLYYIEH